MNKSLAAEALKYTFSDFYQEAILLNGDLVYVHIPTLVKFCQTHNPDKFAQLTQNHLREILPNSKSIYHSGHHKSFRVIALDKFNQLIEE